MVTPALSLRSVVLAAPASFLSSTVGRKVVMAVTGLVLYGFVFGHMTGNLLVFLGPEAMNEYAEFLREFLHGAAIWKFRAILLVSVGLHVWAATALTLGSWAARPARYKVVTPRESTFASRTMRFSGPWLALFIVYHLAHLTIGSAHPDFVEGDAYRNVVIGFSNPLVAGFYVVSMAALGLHLAHGAWSMLQTLGLSHPRWNRLRFLVTTAVTVLIVAGFMSVPIAVALGMVE